MDQRIVVLLVVAAAASVGCVGLGDGEPAQPSSAPTDTTQTNDTTEWLTETATLDATLAWTQVRATDAGNVVHGDNCGFIDRVPAHTEPDELHIEADWAPEDGTPVEDRSTLNMQVFNWVSGEPVSQEKVEPPVNRTIDAWSSGEENHTFYLDLAWWPSEVPDVLVQMELDLHVELTYERPEGSPEPNISTTTGVCT